jgi:hypothetical protein
MESQDLREVIKQEFIKCAQDPAHFMKKYCYIQHPQRGRVIFNLYPFQGKVLNLWKNNRYNIVLKSRQLGISTLGAGYALWLMMFHKDKNVLCIATKQETARNMVTKVKFMYENLPNWLKVPATENNKLSIRLSNGSQIKAVSAASDAGRSEAVSLLLIDEAAFIDGIGEIWASAQQTLATGGGAIVLSTPYGAGNWFHQTWVKAEAAENDFLPIRLPWDVHPERDQAWRDQQDKLLGVRMAAQECDCNFDTSGDVVFISEVLEPYLPETEEPMERRGLDKNLWIWEPVDYSKQYMVVADVARGDGNDYSTFHIINTVDCEQVAEFKGQLSTKDFGNFLVGVATEYNQALLVVENSNVGWAVLQVIEERGYSNLYYTTKNDSGYVETYLNPYEQSSGYVPGFSTTLKTRPLVIAKMVEYVSERSVKIKSKRLLEEMKTFVWKNGKAQALHGYNDDLVMSFAIGMFVRDTALKYRQQGIDLTKQALNNISTYQTRYPTPSHAFRNNEVENPYSMNVNGGQEDIRWLF